MKRILLTLLLLAVLPLQAATVYYVDSGRLDDSGSGLSWATAKKTLQAAIDLASSAAGNEVWVKAGTYKPTTGTLRTVSFKILAGVKVYGGFAGGESQLSERNWRANPVILSGEINIVGNADNSYHVVRMYQGAELDGVVVRDGTAGGSGDGNEGGGIYSIDVSWTARNCLFAANQAPSFTGGAISIRGANVAACVIDRCIFNGNSASYGGALYSSTGVTITNSLFVNNTASTHGGAFRNDYSDVTPFNVSNCTLYNNTAPAGSGAVNVLGYSQFTNCILWGNTPAAFSVSGTNNNCTYSIVQGGLASGMGGGTGVLTADPQFANASDPDGADNLWATPDDGLFPVASSIARDSGTTISGIDKDLRGARRPGGPAFDIGAYERRVIYVKKGMAGDGKSWAEAYGELRDALAAGTSGIGAGDEVWVAAGTYTPTAVSTNLAATFTMPAGVAIYGGFLGDETARSPRDWAVNATILSGSIGSGNKSKHVVTGGDKSLLEGVTIRDGFTNTGGVPDAWGGGILVSGTTPTFRACVITANYGYAGGGAAIHGSTANATFENCLFTANTGQNSAGGAHLQEEARATFRNCTFAGNSASGNGGGAIFVYSCTTGPTIINSVLWGNTTTTSWPSLGLVGSGATIVSSDVQGCGGSSSWNSAYGTNGLNNKDLDPQFLNAVDPKGADGIYGTADDGYVLLTGSPAGNAGTSVGAPTIDLRGASRPLGGAFYDMGCYEGMAGRVKFPSATSSVSEGTASASVNVVLDSIADLPLTVAYTITGGTATRGVAIGNGTDTWDYPLYTWYHDARTTVIYQAAELGGAAQLRTLTLDVTQVPVLSMRYFTIRMKHAPEASFPGGVFTTADWGPNTGWTTVFSASPGSLTVTSTGMLTFPLSGGSGFAYNGTDHLLVDFLFDNAEYRDPRGYVRATSTGANRSLYYFTDSGAGDPFGWANTTPAPNIGTKIPNIRFGTTAASRADVVVASGTLTISAGESSKNIPVTILQELVDEDDETVTFALGTVQGGVLGTQTTHTLTITDDDPLPSVSFVQAASGYDESVTGPTFAVQLTGQTDRTAEVGIARNGGTADASDATVPSVTMSFAPGEMTKYYGITVVNDDLEEATETVELRLQNHSLCQPGTTSLHTYSIADNDVAGVEASASGQVLEEQDEGLSQFQTLGIRLTSQPAAGAVIRVRLDSQNDQELELSVDGGASWTANGAIYFAASAAGTGTGLAQANPRKYNNQLVVRVRGVDESIDDGDQSTWLFLATEVAVGTDASYANLNPPDLLYTTVDDDQAGFVISDVFGLGGGHTTEAPWQGYKALLTSANASTRIVQLGEEIMPGQLRIGMWVSFWGVDSPNRWDWATIDAIDDVNNQLTLNWIRATQAGPLADSYLIIYPAVAVTLASQPKAPVTIPLIKSEDGDEIYAYPDRLTFDPSLWNKAQLVSFYGVGDQTVDGDQTVNIAFTSAESDDSAFNGLDPADVTGLINEDDDIAGLVITDDFGNPVSTIAVAEGGASATFHVRLATQPAHSVTVGVSHPDLGGDQVDPMLNSGIIIDTDLATAGIQTSSLVFDAVSWNYTRTILVMASDDPDIDTPAAPTDPHTRTISLTASSTDGAYNGLTDTVTVSIADNDTAGFHVWPITSADNRIVVQEGGSVQLSVQPRTRIPTGKTVRVTLAVPDPAPDDPFLSITAPAIGYLDFAGGTGMPAAQQITVAGLVDVDALDETGQVNGTVSGDFAPYTGSGTIAHLATLDANSYGFTYNLMGGVQVSESGGATDQYTVRLSRNPGNGVTVVVAVESADHQTWVSPSVLFFTGDTSTQPYAADEPGSWDNGQTITVGGQNDQIDEVAIHSGLIRHRVISIIGGASGYTTSSQGVLSVSVVDDDIPGVQIMPSSGLITTESGGSALFAVMLDTQPAGEAYTDANGNGRWDVGEVYTDANTNGTRDPGKVTIILTSSRPTEVKIGETTDTAGTAVTSKTVVFTEDDWQGARTLRVFGQNDAIDDGDQDFTIQVTVDAGLAATTDATYRAFNPPDITGTNIDDDAVGVVLDSVSLAVSEPNGTPEGVSPPPTAVTYRVKLASEPTGPVTLAIDGGSQLSITPATVYFAATDGGNGASISTPELWSTWVTITVTAADDRIDEAANHTAVITHAVAGGGYAGVAIGNISVSIRDNDTAGITRTGGPFTVGGGNAIAEKGGSRTFTLVLNSQPLSDVTIAVSSGDATEAAVSPATVVFSQTTWDQPRTVTVSGVDDDLDDGTQTVGISFAVASSDPAYNGLTLAAMAGNEITDEDVAGVSVGLPSAGLQVSEGGGTASCTVVLTAKPTGDVQVDLAPGDADDAKQISVAPAVLTFTAANWNQPQAVTVTGRDLDDQDNGAGVAADIAVAVNDAATADTIYDAVADQVVTATVAASNAAPRITTPVDVARTEDQGSFNVVISGIDAGQAGEAQALTFSVRSSDPSLLPDPIPSALSGGQVTLACTPADEASGSAIITVTVTDEASIPTGTPDPARSTTITFKVTIAAVNDIPVVQTDAGSLTFSEGDPPLLILPAAVVSDVDSSQLVSATIVLAAPPDGAAEVLSASTQGTPIIANWDAASATLTLTSPGPQPLSVFQGVLRTVAYRNESGKPTTTTSRTISVTVDDDAGGSSAAATATVDVVDVVFAPQVDLNGSDDGTDTDTGFLEGDDPELIVASGLTVTDRDSPVLVSATATLTDILDAGSEVLSVDPGTSGLTVTWAEPILSITGVAAPATYQQVLRTLSYQHLSLDPDDSADRHVSVVVDDGAGPSAAAMATVGVVAVNDPPVATVNTPAAILIGASLTIDTAIVSVADIDSAAPYTLTVVLAPSQGYLEVDGVPIGPEDSFSSAALLPGAAHPLVYHHQGQTNADDGFAFSISDGTDTSPLYVLSLPIDGLSPPVLGNLAEAPRTWQEHDPAIALDDGADATVTDGDSAYGPGYLAGGALTVSIAGGQTADHIAIAPSAEITLAGTTVSYQGQAFGLLTLLGTGGDPLQVTLDANATAAGVQALVRALRFDSTSAAPSAATRTITVRLDDGTLSTDAVVTMQIAIAPIDDPPVIPPQTIVLAQGLTISGQLSASDPEGQPLTFAKTGAPETKGTFTLNADGSFTYQHLLFDGLVDSIRISVSDGTSTPTELDVPILITAVDPAAPRIVSLAPMQAQAGLPFTYTPVVTPNDVDVEFQLVPAPADAGWIFSGGQRSAGRDGTLTWHNLPTPADGSGYHRFGILVIDHAQNKAVYQPILLKVLPGGGG